MLEIELFDIACSEHSDEPPPPLTSVRLHSVGAIFRDIKKTSIVALVTNRSVAYVMC